MTLGSVSEGHLHVLEVINDRYWKFQYNNKQDFALVRECEDRSPVLLDKIKNFFGLYPVGTHLCQNANDKLVVLYRVVHDQDTIYEDIPLSSLGKMEENRCIKEARKLVLFRFLFALPTTRSDILIRTEHGYSYPVSLRENKIDLCSFLPMTVAQTYLDTFDVPRLVSDWLTVFDTQDYHWWCMSFYSAFEEVELQVDRKDSLRWVADTFRQRLYNNLDTTKEDGQERLPGKCNVPRFSKP